MHRSSSISGCHLRTSAIEASRTCASQPPVSQIWLYCYPARLPIGAGRLPMSVGRASRKRQLALHECQPGSHECQTGLPRVSDKPPTSVSRLPTSVRQPTHECKSARHECQTELPRVPDAATLRRKRPPTAQIRPANPFAPTPAMPARRRIPESRGSAILSGRTRSRATPPRGEHRRTAAPARQLSAAR
jgi:hypothetical protein